MRLVKFLFSKLNINYNLLVVFYIKLADSQDVGKSFSEALILIFTNPQYDKRLYWITSSVHKITISEHVVCINCSECQNKNKTCSELVIFIYWTRNSMNNLLSYCGLVDAKTRASDNYLPVLKVSLLSNIQYFVWKKGKNNWPLMKERELLTKNSL
jgi:hypothetical protein